MKAKRLSLIEIRKAAAAVSTSTKKVVIPVESNNNNDNNIETVKKRKRVKRVRDVVDNIVEEGQIKKKANTKELKGQENSKASSPVKSIPVKEHNETTGPGSDGLCDNKTVYVEGLPYDSVDSDIMTFFESCGQILSIRLPKWHDSGRLRGYGHVQFASADSVKKALDLDGCDMKGRYIKVDHPQTPRAVISADKNEKVVRPAGCRSVFVKNIPYDTTEAEVTETFKVCGPVTCVRLAVWGNTKQLKGFGYIDFKREDSAEIAVKKSGSLTLKGRPVIIDFETGAPKMSFRQADGKVWKKNDSQSGKKK